MFITEEHSVKKKIGFILTKWYVNYGYIVLIIQILDVLY